MNTRSLRTWMDQLLGLREAALKDRIIEIEGELPPLDEVTKNAQVLHFRDASLAFVWKGRFVLTERIENLKPLFTKVDLPYDPREPIHPPVVPIPPGQDLAGDAGSGPGVQAPEFRSFQVREIERGGHRQDGGGGRGDLQEHTPVSPTSTKEATLAYYRGIAEACRRYLKCYDEFFPRCPIDLGEHLDGIEAALKMAPE